MFRFDYFFFLPHPSLVIILISSVCVQHFFLDYDFNDTGSGSGSGDLGADFEEPCDVEHKMTTDLQRVFLPVVYALIFTLGITGNGLVVVVLGCQRRLEDTRRVRG